ncbi:MAG: hypothetical protein ACTSUO_04180 [Candidatus Thorarchaeota archaeon]
MPRFSEMIRGLVDSVVFFFDTEERPIGTGFLTGYPIDDESLVPFIVTAKHVIQNHSEVIMRIIVKNEKDASYTRIDLDEIRSIGDYWTHTDKGVGIVVFQTDILEKIECTPYHPKYIATKSVFSELGIKASDHVQSPSLLMKFRNYEQNYSIMQSGSIVLIPDEKLPMQYIEGKRKITVEQDVFAVQTAYHSAIGGAPVFLIRSSLKSGNERDCGQQNRWLVGIVFEFYEKEFDERKKIETITMDGKVVSFMESLVALVFPSWRVLEILEGFAVRSRMKVHMKLQRENK